MAIINSYPKDINIQDKDAWIGTDSYNRQTRQYTAESVAKYLNTKGRIAVSAQMVFKYWTNSPPNTQAPGPGDFYGPAAGTAITSITTMQVSKQDVSGQDVVAFMDYIVGGNILISEQNNISIFGDFLIDSYTINDPDDDFYTLNLTNVGGSGNLTELLYFDFALKGGDYVAGINAGEYINIGNPSGAVPTINHDITGRVDTSSADSALTFPVIDTITTNNTGHVTSVNTKTVTVPASIDGSGTANFVTKWIDADTIGDSLMFDNGTSVGIGTTSPGSTLTVSGPSSNQFQIINSTNNKSWRPNVNGNDFYITESGVSNPFVIQAGGNVGIGTTSPGSKLHVSGGDIELDDGQEVKFDISGTVTASEELVLDAGNTDSKIILNGADSAMQFITGNSTAIAINDSQYVGIGTTNPTVPFEVISNNNTAARFYRPGSRTTVKIDSDVGRTSSLIIAQGNVTQYYVGMPTQAISGLGARFAISYKGAPNFTMTGANGTIGINTTSANLQSGGEGIHVNSSDIHSEIKFTNSTTGTTASDGTALVASGSGFVINNREAGNLTLGTNNSTRVLINSIGKVGIGTTNPQQKLHVNGATQLGDINATVNFGTVALKVVEGTISTEPTLGSGTVGAQAVLYSNGAFGMYTGVSTNGDTWMQSQRNDASTDTYNILLNPLGGNVGIGTTSPSNRLDIRTNGVGDGIKLATSTSAKFASITNGNSETFPFGKFTMNYGGTTPVQIVALSNELQLSGGYTTGGKISFRIAASEQMRLTETGLGIGTTSPSAKLDIVGTTSSDYAPLTPVTLIGKTASGTGWTGTDVLTGYTHTPGNSDSLVTNITPTANTKYQVTFTVSGITAGRFDFINFGGTAVSIYAGSNRTATVSFITGNTNPLEITAQSATAGTISIDSIVSVGARDSVTNIRNSSGVIVNQIRTGATSGSIYIGLEAGQSLPSTNSLSNTAIGFRALKNNLQGGYNTIIGYGNAQSSFASSYITAIGHNIFPSLKRTGNIYSTAVGTNIGASSSFMGAGNVLMGNNILLYATTAGNNIALGYNTMRNATTGSNNIGLGASTLVFNTTGGNNVSLGTLSLTNLTTGSSNIAIGYGAGRYVGGSTTKLTVANSSTFIGYNSRPNGDSQTNQIVIGHNAIGAGSNSATIGSTTISKTILNGDVGIGTTDPISRLDVSGGDIEVKDIASGIIMKSPDGTRYRVTIANGGTLSVAAV